MIILAAVDEKNGMMFNHRRQTQDRVLRQHILDMTKGSRLWVNHYTKTQFADADAPQLQVCDDFLREAAPGEYCFVEDAAVAPYEKRIEKIILFQWNRTYPADFYFDINVSASVWRRAETEEFSGSSHERITKEVYVRE